MSKKIRDAFLSKKNNLISAVVVLIMGIILFASTVEALNVSKTENLQNEVDKTSNELCENEVIALEEAEKVSVEKNYSVVTKLSAESTMEDSLNFEEEKDKKLEEDIITKSVILEETTDMSLTKLVFTETNDTVYSKTGLNVRALPTVDSERVGYLSFNREVTRLGNYDNGWSKILYDGKECYVSTEYISTEKQAKIPVVTESYPVLGPHDVPEGCVPCYTHGISYITQEEYEMFLVLAMSEAGGASYDCVVACMETVLNRMAMGYGTMEQIIDDAYYINWKKVPNQKCIDAVNQVLTVQTYPSNMIYFRTKHYHRFGTPYMSIDNVYFSLRN